VDGLGYGELAYMWAEYLTRKKAAESSAENVSNI
jgi:hypothetical protein